MSELGEREREKERAREREAENERETERPRGRERSPHRLVWIGREDDGYLMLTIYSVQRKGS